jgi:hypothetical protein
LKGKGHFEDVEKLSNAGKMRTECRHGAYN